MKIIKDKISLAELREMSKKMFGNLVKAVVDVEKGIMVVDGELHSDEAELLVDMGSSGNNLWGINLYPDTSGQDWLEFDSVINLKPNFGNKTRNIEDAGIRQRIAEIVDNLVEK